MMEEAAMSSEEAMTEQLNSLNQKVSELFEGDVLFLCAPLIHKLDDIIREEIEKLKACSVKPESQNSDGVPEAEATELVETDANPDEANLKSGFSHPNGKGSGKGDEKSKLIVMLETSGGTIEVTERIARVFRHHYDIVEFIVPNHAYSAGTVLVMSGDEIHMDYYSVLGPIDPQIEAGDGSRVSGVGHLTKFNELCDRINKSPNIPGMHAELAFLLAKFDPAVLSSIEQATEYSKSLVEQWLPKYKFKDWEITDSSNEPVTDAMLQKRARTIADTLGNTDRWHSHGRGISREELVSEEIKLKICDFGDDEQKAVAIREYYNSLKRYMLKTGSHAIIHTQINTYTWRL